MCLIRYLSCAAIHCRNALTPQQKTYRTICVQATQSAAKILLVEAFGMCGSVSWTHEAHVETLCEACAVQVKWQAGREERRKRKGKEREERRYDEETEELASLGFMRYEG